MRMDFDKCVELVRKYGSRDDPRELMKAASKPYRKTKIQLTYLSMPDWLAVMSAARSPAGTGSGEEPIYDALRGMAWESDIGAVLDFMWFDSMQPTQRELLFHRLVVAYKFAVERHQKTIADCLDCFTRTGSGRALLAELGRTTHTITVMPHWLYFMTLPGNGYRNATTKALRDGQILSHVTDGLPDSSRDGFAKGASIPSLAGSETGTGAGAGVIIYYSAGTWTDTVYADYSVGAAGFQPDEVLFHELVHATRLIRGKMNSTTVQGRPNFGDIEEYFATVIANIYMSEKGKDVRLRGAYAPGSASPPNDWSVMKDPDGFYDNNDGLSMPPSQLMDTFQRTQMQFYHDLAVLTTPPWFNPVRTHFNRNQIKKNQTVKKNQGIPV
jgi:Effector protein